MCVSTLVAPHRTTINKIPRFTAQVIVQFPKQPFNPSLLAADEIPATYKDQLWN